jgi:hypothetical protein
VAIGGDCDDGDTPQVMERRAALLEWTDVPRLVEAAAAAPRSCCAAQ